MVYAMMQTVQKAAEVPTLFSRTYPECVSNTEETTEESCCVGVLIRDHSGDVVATLCLSAPTYRSQNSRECYRPATVETIRQIPKSLRDIPTKYSPPDTPLRGKMRSSEYIFTSRTGGNRT